MALYRARCSICQASKGNPKLRARIREAAFNRQEGDETLRDIAFQYNLNPASMYTHAKKHITDRTDQNEQLREAKLAKAKISFAAAAQKEQELALSAQTVDEVEARPMEIVTLDQYIMQGAAAVRKGELKMTPQSFLAAIKIKTDWSKGQQSNKIELMRTMMAFAAGNKQKGTQNDGTTEEVAGRLGGGEEESSSIYRAAFGDAPTPGTEKIHSEEDAARA